MEKKPNNDRRLLLILLSPFLFVAFCLLVSFLSVVAISILQALGR
jgi:hypothetical protein